MGCLCLWDYGCNESDLNHSDGHGLFNLEGMSICWNVSDAQGTREDFHRNFRHRVGVTYSYERHLML